MVHVLRQSLALFESSCSLPRSTMAVLKAGLLFIILPIVGYFGTLILLIASPTLQTHLFYLHRISLIGSQDVNVPEAFGFLKGQVTPFFINTSDNEALHTWHVLPHGLYRRHKEELEAETTGLASDITSTFGFWLLQNDPDACVVIFLHGTAGCVASGWRPYSHRNVQSAAPDKIHVIAFDYRGYGLSTGTSSEEGLLLDAIAVVDCVIDTAGIPSDRIVIFGQSLGTAVGLSLLSHYASQNPPVAFAGSVFVATFSDVATLTSTYHIGGIIPVLSPLARIPVLLDFFTSFLTSTWLSKDRLSDYIRLSENQRADQKYDLTLIHAEDDADIACNHSEIMFWHAVNATTTEGLSYDKLSDRKDLLKKNLGNGGWEVEWRTSNGVIRQQMLKYGLHDKVMAYPVVALAVLRAFQNAAPDFAV